MTILLIVLFVLLIAAHRTPEPVVRIKSLVPPCGRN